MYGRELKALGDRASEREREGASELELKLFTECESRERERELKLKAFTEGGSEIDSSLSTAARASCLLASPFLATAFFHFLSPISSYSTEARASAIWMTERTS